MEETTQVLIKLYLAGQNMHFEKMKNEAFLKKVSGPNRFALGYSMTLIY